MRVKEESGKAGLNLNIKKKKTEIMSSSPITSWQTEGQVTDSFSCALKPLLMVTAAMKLEDDCILAGKL